MTRAAAAANSARNAKPPRQTEADFQRDLVKIARQLGWGITHQASKKLAEEAAQWGVKEPLPLDGLIFHPRIMYRSEPGWPDLTLVRARDRRLIFAELKAEDGKPSARQLEVLELLRSICQPMDCGQHKVPARPLGPDPRCAECPTWIQVFVWRPSDTAEIHRILG